MDPEQVALRAWRRRESLSTYRCPTCGWHEGIRDMRCAICGRLDAKCVPFLDLDQPLVFCGGPTCLVGQGDHDHCRLQFGCAFRWRPIGRDQLIIARHWALCCIWKEVTFLNRRSEVPPAFFWQRHLELNNNPTTAMLYHVAEFLSVFVYDEPTPTQEASLSSYNFGMAARRMRAAGHYVPPGM